MLKQCATQQEQWQFPIVFLLSSYTLSANKVCKDCETISIQSYKLCSYAQPQIVRPNMETQRASQHKLLVCK